MEKTISQLISEAKKTSQIAIMTPRFQIGLPPGEVLELLKNYYREDVRDRGKEFRDDEDTNKRLRQLAGWLTSGKNRPSLLLYGGVGNGKTTMVEALASTIDCIRDTARDMEKKYGYGLTPEEKQEVATLRRFIALPSPRIVTAQKLASLAKDDEENYKKFSEARFLIIDDLGCEPVSVKNYGTEITPVTNIIYRRYETMATTVITTNLDRKDIRSLYGLRVSDRIEEAYDSIAFTNDSYRKRQ